MTIHDSRMRLERKRTIVKLRSLRFRLSVFVVVLVCIGVMGWTFFHQVSEVQNSSQLTFLARLVCKPYISFYRNELYLPVNELTTPVDPPYDSAPVRFVVEPEETHRDVAARLFELDLTHDPFLFRCYVNEEGLRLKPGEYVLNRTMDLIEIAELFDQGLTDE